MYNKVVIYYATAGAGHKSAALALEAAFQQSGAAKEVVAIDALDYTSKSLTKLYRDTYLKMVGKAPHLLGWAYDKTDTPWERERRRLFFDRMQSRKFLQLLRASDADLAVCTHFLPSELISWLRAERRITTPQAVVITDFDAHGMWLCRHYEQFFVALDQTRAYLESLGIVSSKISVHGIPIHPVFPQAKDKIAMRKKHDLITDRTTILLSAGGYGVGPVKEIVQGLLNVQHPVQVTAMCGRNESLKRQIAAMAEALPQGHPASIVPVGFTKEMDEYMSAADLVVGKPGGLTTSEALAKGLAFVVVNPIPGQEDRNSHHLLQQGAGIRCQDIKILGWMIDDLLGKPRRLKTMQKNALAMGRPNAAFDIVQTLVNLRRGPA